MANIEMWCMDGIPMVRVGAPDLARRIIVNVEGDQHSGALRLTSDEAVKLRDDLARAITEAATAAAKAVQAEGAQA